MAKITVTEYGYRDFNKGWGELNSTIYYEDSAKVINELYEKFGDRLWNSIETPNLTTTIANLYSFESQKELEIIIEE